MKNINFNDAGFWSRLGGIVALGAALNLLVLGYVAGLVGYVRAYGPSGINRFGEFLKAPGDAFGGLLFNSGPVPAEVHETYMFGPLQAIYWGMLALLALRLLIFPTKRNKAADKHGSHGTSRWATKGEILNRFKAKKGIVLGWVFWLGMKKELIYPISDGENRHLILYGGTRSGKSKSIIIPNVLHNAKHLHEHMLITSSKLEVYFATAPTLRSEGYQVHLVNLVDLARSDRYNPMDFVQNSLDASVLATTIIKNTTNEHAKDAGDVWERAEVALLEALILYLKLHRPKKEQHLRNVLELGLSIGDNEKKCDKLFMSLPKDDPARIAYRSFNQAKDRTRSGVLFGFAGRMRLFGQQEIASLSCASDFDLKDFSDPKKKMALFVVTPSETETFNLFPAMLIDQLYQVLFREARKFPEEKLEREVNFFLDEIANIAPIAGLKKKIATMGGHGMWTTLVFQSKHQFEERYGKGVAEEIMDSCDTCLLLGTNNQTTKKHFSEQLGPTTREIGKQENPVYVGRNLLTPEEVGREISKDELVIFQRAEYPVKAKKNFCTSWRHWKSIPKFGPKDVPVRVREPVTVMDVEQIFSALPKEKPKDDVLIREGV